MRCALRSGIGGLLEPLDEGVGDDGAVEVLLHPARRLGRAQRRDPDQQEEAARRRVLGEPRGVAPHDAGIHAELGLRELGAGRDLGRELVRLPAGRRVDRRVGGAEEELRLAGDLASGRQLAACRAGRAPCAVSVVESRSNTGLVSGWSPALGSSPVRHRRLRTPVAAAPIRSPCSAMRLRSRQVNCRIGSMPSRTSMRGRDRRREVRAGAGAVGDVDGVGEAAQRQRLAHEVVGVARDRRRDLGGDDELPRSQQLFQARSRLSRRWRSSRSGVSGAMPRRGVRGWAGCLYSRSPGSVRRHRALRHRCDRLRLCGIPVGRRPR